jgi:tetratricopeptide (TPR) repeat protein
LAQDKSTQIGQEVKRLAENHYRSGQAYYRIGRYTLARQEFLTALRYDPEHLRAKKMFTTQRKLEHIDRYVLHTIQPDESISTLAQLYYGDYKKFHLIALYNELEDAAKVRVGQQIKIPVIEGVPIMADPSEFQTDPGKAPKAKSGKVITVKGFIIHTVKAEESLSGLAQLYYGDFKKFDLIAKFNDMEETYGLRVGQEIKIPEVEGIPFLATEKDKDIKEVKTPEIVPVAEEIPQQEPAVEPEIEKDETSEEDQAAAYRELGIELFKQKNYADAIIELQKALNANPADKVAKNHLSLAYYEQGVVSFDNQDYTQAIEAFETSRTYNSNCDRCETYIKKSEENFKDLHYRNGISFFWREKLAEAIEEWELVYEMDPDYEDVDINIERVRNLMKRLEEIKQSKEKSEEDHVVGYRQLGIELFKKGDFTNSIIELRKALFVNPDDKEAKRYLSLAYFKQELLQYPEFPWPPPRASAIIEIPDKLFRKFTHKVYSLSDINEILINSLNQCGYLEKSYFAIRDGFAIVTRLEQINSDGSPKEDPIRWTTDFKPIMEFSLKAYIAALLKGKIGYYRVIVFLITPHPISQTEETVTSADAMEWTSRGSNRPPITIVQKPYTPYHRCTALIYEFEKKDTYREAKIRLPGKIPARSHLENSNIWSALEQK